MQTVVMAGGEGARLRPLTCSLPKPLAPMLGRPLIHYTLALCRRHSLRDVTLTLCYRPRDIMDAVGDGTRENMSIRFAEETCPLGTAGSVRKAWREGEDTALVLSGDGLTDCDLTAAIDFHRQKRAMATLVLKTIDIPLSYGVVLTNDDGRVTSFIEKPTWSKVAGNRVNTGIYILDKAVLSYIKPDCAQDFSRDVFPRLLERGEAMFGFEMTGYWCDIGDIPAYLQAQRDLLMGRVQLPLPKRGQPVLERGAAADDTAFFGDNVRLCEGARVRGYAVIGDNCVLGAGASATDACLLDNASLGARAGAEDCLVCSHALLQSDARMERGSVLGESATLGARARLGRDTRVWPGNRVSPSAVVTEHVVHGECRKMRIENGAFCELTPSRAARIGTAYHVKGRKTRVLLSHTGDESLYDAVAGALLWRGARVLKAGAGTLASVRHAMACFHADGAMLCGADTLTLVDERGDSLPYPALRDIEAASLREDAPPRARSGRCEHIENAGALYAASLQAGELPVKLPVAVFCDNRFVRSAARGLLEEMHSLRIAKCADMRLSSEETGILIDDSGSCIALFTHDIPPDYSAVPGLPAGDALRALPHLLRMLAQRSAEELLASAPERPECQRAHPCSERDKARALFALSQTPLPHTQEDGLVIEHPRGRVRICPDEECECVRIHARAHSAEIARELCDLYDAKLTSALCNKS